MIHESGIIHKGAKLDKGVSVGAYSVIGPHVEIGKDTIIGPHVVIEGRTKIGCDNRIFQFASIGAIPQDKKYKGEETFLEIGDGNIFRECCTVHLGTAQGENVTKIGNNNLFMNYVHIAHDCVLGDDNVLSNHATLAGHVKVGNFVILSGFVKVAQFCSIGDYSFVGGNSDITKDILPYVLVSGSVDTVKVYGLNLVGLKRNGFSDGDIDFLKRAYNIIFRKGLTVSDAVLELEGLVGECGLIRAFIENLNLSSKGILR